MTVPSSTNRTPDYACNGVTVAFPYGFKIFAASDLVVTLTDPDGAESTLILGVDYTVSGVGSPDGGTVTTTVPPATGWRLSAERVLAATQDTNLRNQGPYFAEVVERALDVLTMLVQQVMGRVGAALRLPVGEAPSDLATILPPLEQRKGHTLGFDPTTGQPGAYAPLSGTVSAAMEPVVEAATLAQARSALLEAGTITNAFIAPGTIERDRLYPMETGRLLGNLDTEIPPASGSAPPQDLTPAQARQLLQITYVAQSRVTAAPNATVPAHALAADGAEANVDLVLAPKGTGAITAQVPDGTAAGGDKRGPRAIDLQTQRAAADQVASSDRAVIVGGDNNKVTGIRAVCVGGSSNVVSAQDSGVVAAFSASVQHSSVLASGTAPRSKQQSTRIHGLSQVMQAEDANVYLTTTDATPTPLYGADATRSLALDDDEAVIVLAQVVGYQRGGTNNAAGYIVEFTAKRATGVATTALVGSPVVRAQENNAAWDCTVVANTSVGGIEIRVTGAAGVTIDWFACIHVARVKRS